MNDTTGTARPSAWHVAFVCLALLMGMNAFYWAFGAAPDKDAKITVTSNRDNILYVGLWLLLYLVSCAIVVKAWMRDGISIAFLCLMPFAAYVIASAGWAEHASASAIKATMLTLNIVIAEALCCIVGPVHLLKILARVSLTLLAISFVMLAIAPKLVLSDALRPGLLMSGELFGAFGSKGILGRMACFSIVIILFLPGIVADGWKKIVAVAALVLGALLANAMSAILGGVLAVVLLIAARLLPRVSKLLFAIAATAAVGWSLAVPFIDIGGLATSVGRTADLTGRGDFWPMAPGVILSRPYLGYGYDDFFDPTPYAGGWQIWNHERWFFTPDFHNNAIDVAVGLGLVGLGFYLLILALALAVFSHRTMERRSREILAAFLISVTMSSGTEDNFLVHNSITTILMFYCVLTAGRRYRDTREGHGSPPGIATAALQPGHAGSRSFEASPVGSTAGLAKPHPG